MMAYLGVHPSHVRLSSIPVFARCADYSLTCPWERYARAYDHRQCSSLGLRMRASSWLSYFVGCADLPLNCDWWRHHETFGRHRGSGLGPCMRAPFQFRYISRCTDLSLMNVCSGVWPSHLRFVSIPVHGRMWDLSLMKVCKCRGHSLCLRPWRSQEYLMPLSSLQGVWHSIFSSAV